MQGVVKKKMDKGFGFITAEGLPKDLFFHKNSLEGVTFEEIQEGDKVEFDMEDSPKGPNATHVKRVQTSDGIMEDSPKGPNATHVKRV